MNWALLLEQNGKDTVALAPFMSEEAVGRLAELRAKNGRSIGELLPFAGKEKLGEVALAKVLRGEDVTAMLPFLGDKALGAITKEKLARGESITELLPFLDDSTLREYVKRRWAVKFAAWRGLSRLTSIFPCCGGKARRKHIPSRLPHRAGGCARLWGSSWAMSTVFLVGEAFFLCRRHCKIPAPVL